MVQDRDDVRPSRGLRLKVGPVRQVSLSCGFYIVLKKNEQKDHKLHNVSVPISNPEVETGNEADGIIGCRKRGMSLKQGSCLAGLFQRIQNSRSNVLWVPLSQ